MQTTEKNTTQATIMLTILKELRLSRSLPQAFMSENMGKSANYWNKIENAQGALSLNDFLTACSALKIHPNSALLTLENYISFFHYKGWYVFSRDEIEKDDLWELTQAYYETDAFKSKAFVNQDAIDILSTPMNIRDSITGYLLPWPNMRLVFRYALDPNIKKMMDDYLPGSYPQSILLTEPPTL